MAILRGIHTGNRPMMRCVALFAIAVSWAVPAPGATVSERPDSVTVTIYHDGDVNTAELSQSTESAYTRSLGLAFITETRTIDLPGGPSEIEFRDVASTIVPQTADIQGLPAGVLERNFDYDLLSPGSLLTKSVGQTVRLVRTDSRTGAQTEQTAVLRSAPSGVMLEIDGKLEALGCSGLPEKLVFDKTPDGLRDTPTLSVRTNASAAGHYTIQLTYIATGLNWSSDYIARIRPDGRSLDLTGWITLANFSATSFVHAPVEVVAGHTESTGADKPVSPQELRLSRGCWPLNVDWAKNFGSDKFVVGLDAPPPPPPPPPPPMVETVVATANMRRIEAIRLGDYKLFRLPERTDVHAQQTKQVQFLDQDGVPFKRIYTYYLSGMDAGSEDTAAMAMIELQNTAAAGLGKPLPAGSVSVTEPAVTGTDVLIGQNRVLDTPEGLPLKIETGRAIDVRVHRRLVSVTETGKSSNRIRRWTEEVSVENGKTVAVVFELGQTLDEGAREIEETLPHAVKPEGLIWSFPLAAGERRTIRYTIEQPET
jgi:hypothetical protein